MLGDTPQRMKMFLKCFHSYGVTCCMYEVILDARPYDLHSLIVSEFSRAQRPHARGKKAVKSQEKDVLTPSVLLMFS